MRPPQRAAGFATHPLGCMPWHLGLAFVRRCIDPPLGDLYRCTRAWTDDLGAVRVVKPRCVKGGCPRAGRSRQSRMLAVAPAGARLGRRGTFVAGGVLSGAVTVWSVLVS